MERVIRRPSLPLTQKTEEFSESENRIDIEELESLLKIDEHDLVDAGLTQSKAFYRVAKAVALYTSRRDAAKQELQEVEARIATAIRHDYEVRGDKITEARIGEQVLLDSSVQTARRRLHTFNERLGLLVALKDGFLQRSYVIKDLATLWVAGYYGDLSVRGSENEVKSVQANRAKKVLQKMREGEYNA